MTGILSGVDYSVLMPGASSGLNAAGNILSLLYGGATAPPPPTDFVSSGNPILDLRLAQTNQATAIADEAKQPQVLTDITAFKTAVSHARTIQDALLNPDIQKVLLTASGLSNYIGETTLVQKALLSNPADPKSLVNQMGDGTLLSTVATYNFATTGLAQLQNPKVVATLTSAYAQVKWQQSLDQATPGLSYALAFLGQASAIGSADDILGNMANFQVVTTALGIPQQIVNLDSTAAQRELNAHLDYSKFQNPAYVTSLTDQFLLNMQAQTGTTGSGASILNLFA